MVLHKNTGNIAFSGLFFNFDQHRTAQDNKK